MKLPTSAEPTWVNDVHSSLNPTSVSSILFPETLDDVVEAIRFASRENRPISVAGCRHAMGGQQFVSDGLLLDIRSLAQIAHFDLNTGLIRVGAGIQWPALISEYLAAQADGETSWGIAQKQTGADTFTLGGSLSANVHGRGLSLRPIVQDVEAFTLVRADGTVAACSRRENPDLFALAIGGYGLFGVIADVTLRLTPQHRLERTVEIITSDELEGKFSQRIAEGFVFGDFQFSIDETSPDFLREGVFSCYRPTERPAPSRPERELEEVGWLQLLHLAYTNRALAFKKYAEYYLSTSGQVYWSDLHQLSPYLPDYARRIQKMTGSTSPSSLMITELYVPRDKLASFLQDAARELGSHQVTVIYGTVRLIEKDTESFLAWARESYGCIIFNLIVEPGPAGREKAAGAFRALIDLAIANGGNYYLTYHRFATATQVRQCYPQFDNFLAAKRQHDPTGLFQSDWYRHHLDICVSEND